MTVDTNEANGALLELAMRCEQRQQYVGAIKCLRAILRSDPLPGLRFEATMILVDLYTRYTTSTSEARFVLNKLVRAGRGASRLACFVFAPAARCRLRL